MSLCCYEVEFPLVAKMVPGGFCVLSLSDVQVFVT